MKTTENIIEENETDINQIETILPYENNEINIEENLKEKNKKNKKLNLIKFDEEIKL